MEKYKCRDDVPLKYRWDLTEYCKDEKEYEVLFNKSVKMIDNISKYVGCTKDANKLYEYLKDSTTLVALIDKLYVYAICMDDQELGNSVNMDRLAKIEDAVASYSKATNFFEPELLKLTKEEYDNLYKANDNLNKFKFFLDSIYRCKEHIISDDKENIVTSLVSAMDNFASMSSAMLNSEHDYGTINIDGEEVKIATTNYRKLMQNKDREIRKEIRKKYNITLDRYGVSSAQFLNCYVKGNIETAKIHNYDNAWERKIFELNMPDEAYRTLCSTVEKHLDVLHRYYRIFKNTFNLDELHQYDLNLQLATTDKEYSIEDAQELCLKAVEPLGSAYVSMFKTMFDERRIDYAQYPKKCSGGYNISALKETSRILMSYNYDLDSVSTIAHEGGHNIHHVIMNKNTPIQYREITSLIGEVASLTNECLLSNYLMNNGSNIEEKKAGINNIIRVIVTNLFGSVREGKMEQDFYNHVLSGNSITKDYMDKLTVDSLKKYYGDEVVLDEYSKNSWIVRSHYYMDYYLFDYAFCISVATYVASEILNGNKEMLDRYMKFLSIGSDSWPIDTFKILGIDLTKKEVYEKAIQYFESLLDKFEELSK